MRVLILTSLAAAAALLAACARAPEAPTTEPAIWRIADADSEIWLFGTAHMLRPEQRWRGARVSAAFAAADELVTETDASPAGVEAAQALSLQYGMQAPGEALSDVLPPETHAQLLKVAGDVGVNPNELEVMRPWLAALRLSFAYALSRGLRPEAGVENVLAAEARERGMRMSFFETPEQQVRFLADLPEPDQTRFLADTLREIESDAEALDNMDALWARGDTEALAALFDAQWQAGSPALHEVIILQRNRAWADEIARRLDGQGRVFIAVGAAHLVGEGNVVSLLRARGVTVEGP